MQISLVFVCILVPHKGFDSTVILTDSEVDKNIWLKRKRKIDSMSSILQERLLKKAILMKEQKLKDRGTSIQNNLIKINDDDGQIIFLPLVTIACNICH